MRNSIQDAQFANFYFGAGGQLALASLHIKCDNQELKGQLLDS